MSYTPGPWTASNAPDGSGIPGWNITGADGTTICSLSDATPRFVRLNPINACLIAASPTLLEACKATIEFIEAGETSPTSLLAKLYAAIAQANGEKP